MAKLKDIFFLGGVFVFINFKEMLFSLHLACFLSLDGLPRLLPLIKILYAIALWVG